MSHSSPTAQGAALQSLVHLQAYSCDLAPEHRFCLRFSNLRGHGHSSATPEDAARFLILAPDVGKETSQENDNDDDDDPEDLVNSFQTFAVI